MQATPFPRLQHDISKALMLAAVLLISVSCSLFEKSPDGGLMLKKAEVNVRDVKITGVVFDTVITFSDGKKFDIQKPDIGIVKYLGQIKAKKFDFTIKELQTEAILEIVNPVPYDFTLANVSVDFYLDQEKIFNVQDELGIQIAKDATTESPIKGTLPLNSNFLKIMGAENIIMKGVAGLKVEVLGKEFTYNHDFEHTYRIPKEEMKKKIDATVDEYIQKAADYVKSNIPGGGSSIGGTDVGDLLKLLQ